MRVVALIAVVAVLVAGGFWLARDRDAATTPASSTTTTPTTTNVAASSGTVVTPATTAADEPVAQAATGADDADDDAVDAATEAVDETSAEGTTSEPAADQPAEDADAADQDGQSRPGAEATEPDADGTPTDATSDAAAEVDLASLLPVGYTPVPFLTDEPKRLFESAEQVLEQGNDYVALLHTNRGDIVVDLYEDRTPITVNNFVFLALNRYYQGVPFHRVLEDFMAQTGDPTGTGSGGPGYQFDDEIVDGIEFDSAGQLAMANAGPGTNGSQFFITFAATPWLTGAHTIFGEIMSGSEVLDSITRIDPSSPSAIVTPDQTITDLADQGIELPGAPDTTIAQALDDILGTGPVMGQSFTAAGYRGVMGQMGNEPAYGFFPQPDTILDVVIGVRPQE